MGLAVTGCPAPGGRIAYRPRHCRGRDAGAPRAVQRMVWAMSHDAVGCMMMWDSLYPGFRVPGEELESPARQT